MQLVTITLIVLAIVGALVAGLGGFALGMVVGTLNRLFFRTQFKEFLVERMATIESELAEGVQNAQVQAQSLVAAAHAEAQQIYKQAAQHAINAGMVEGKVRGPKEHIN